MEYNQIIINVIIDAEIFRKFALFDAFYRQRRWVSPALFASIMIISACVCFSMRDSAESAVLLGGVLLSVGLGLPAVYFFTFLSSVKKQIDMHKLKTPRPVYTLSLSGEPDGIRVSNGGEAAAYEWKNIYKAYRVFECTYLYVTAAKAFIIPDKQIEGGAGLLLALLTSVLPPEKLNGRRNGSATSPA